MLFLLSFVATADDVITRECLMTLRHSEKHREKLPTVQRHNYCEPGKNNDPKHPYDNKMMFCFCNDKDGCNTAARTKMASGVGILVMALAATLFALL